MQQVQQGENWLQQGQTTLLLLLLLHAPLVDGANASATVNEIANEIVNGGGESESESGHATCSLNACAPNHPIRIEGQTCWLTPVANGGECCCRQHTVGAKIV